MNWKEVNADDLTRGVREMVSSVHGNPLRTAFFYDAHKFSGTELYERYFPETLRVKAERFARVGMCRIGIYASVKRIITRLKAIRR